MLFPKEERLGEDYFVCEGGGGLARGEGQKTSSITSTGSNVAETQVIEVRRASI